MEPQTNLVNLHPTDVAKVVVLGVLQAATLAGFVLLLMTVVDALGATTLGPTAAAAWRVTLLQLGALALVTVAHSVLRAWEFNVAEKAGYRVVADIRMRMYRHLQGMMPRQFQNRSRGGLLLRFTGDLSMLRMWISRGLLGGSVALIVLVTGLLTVLVLNFYIGLTLMGVLAAGAAVSVASGPTMRRATRAMRRRRSLLTSNIDEQLNALAVPQVFGRSRGEHARLARQNISLLRALYRVAELRGRLRGLATGSALLTVVCVLAVGLIEVQRQTATTGLVVAAIVASRLLATPVRKLGLAHDYWHRARVSRQKILDFLRSSSRDLEPPGLERLVARRPTIEFRNVSVPGALEKVTVTARAGRLIGITGPNGSGKSTLLGLVARLVEPSEGEVVIDGQVLAQTTPRSTFRKIGMVSPDLPLMRGTVRRNITYRMRRADPDELRRVVFAVGLDRVLAELPQGLETWLVEGGRNLSFGQRQLIALARAMIGNPPILLLDEPTVGLDDDAKAAVRYAVSHHHGTVLLATQDPADLSLADEVWVLDRGRLTEVIPTDEYRTRLWQLSRKEDGWTHAAAN